MNEQYMVVALQEAQKALNRGEVPVGAVIVKNNRIIARAYNQKEKKKNVTKHAEIIAIERASKKNKNWRLSGCDIYVTLFPCPMCASAIQQARIENVYYALQTSDSVSFEIGKKILSSSNTNKKVNVYQTSHEVQALSMLQNFFQKKR